MLNRHIDFSFNRTALGLTIRLTRSVAETNSESYAFSDHTFSFSATDLAQLIDHVGKKRLDLAKKIEAGDVITLLIPQIDPPVIRVTSTGRGAYFNLGELWRWRFLKELANYPFKEHQLSGVKWLRKRAVAILADDMGLGKTLQAIAAFEGMQRSDEIENVLVVCPKSLIGTWEAEISLWAPRLCTVALYSSIASREWETVAAQCHVAITNYEAIRKNRPSRGAFDLVIFDEIHKLKNSQSLNYSAAYQLMPRFAWGLSGTPLENNAGDLSAILHLLDRKRVSPTDKHLPTASLRSLAASYVMRRNKSVISRELPALIEKTEILPLAPEQKRAYDQARRGLTTCTLGAWIAMFNRLRDICDYDPRTKKSSKIDRAVVIVNAVRELGEKIVVFSWKIEPLRLLHLELSERHGADPVVMLTGQTESTRRSTVVKSFQTRQEPSVLLCSIRATAEGLTLTAANHVLFLNEWWNPAVNAQARDRVNRIGQSRNVCVYRLRTQGTVESRLDDLLKHKSMLFDKIVNQLAKPSAHSNSVVPRDLLYFLEDEEKRSQGECLETTSR